MDADIVDVVRAAVDSLKSQLFTAVPGIVTAWDPLTNTVIVQPAIKEALYASDDSRVYEELPEIPFVPVIWPRAGDYAMTMPILPGDSGLLVFSKLSTAEWRERGQLSEPADARVLSCGYPFFIPGAFPDVSPISPAPLDLAARTVGPVFGEHGGSNRVEINPIDGIKLGREAVSPVALAPPLIVFAEAIKTALGSLLAPPAAATFEAAVTAFEAAIPATKVKAL